MVKNLPTMRETWVWSLGWEDPLEKEMVTHSSILAWEIPWIEEPGGLQPMGSQRVQDWTANTRNIWTEVSELWEVLQVSGPCGYFYLVVESCLTLLQPMDCSLPGFSVHGIFQARILEWIAISFSRGSSQPRDRTWVFCIAGRIFTLWAKGKSFL